MKLSSVPWILRYRLLQPVLNWVVFIYHRFFRVRLHPVYRGMRQVAWILRWRIGYPVTKLFLPSFIVRALYPARSRGLVRFLKDRSVQSVPLRNFGHHSADADAPQTQIYAAARVAAPQALMFPAHAGLSLSKADQDYDFPPTCVQTIRHATVIGRSNMVFADGVLQHHALYRFSHDFTSEELHGKIRISPETSTVKRYEISPKERLFDQAAMFLDSCSSNYAHWLTEVLPRINAYWNGLGQTDGASIKRRICDDGQPMPLLLDDKLHPNIENSLRAVVGQHARVVRVANTEHVEVSQLMVTTPTGYVPFDRRSFKLQGHSEGVFSPTALQQLRQHLSATLPEPSQPPPKKIFLKRNTKVRSMLNAESIETRLSQEGFTSVSTELMSFAEQFHTFSGADIVVGATGAAFANLIFCKPNAKIVICIARFENTSYGYWQNLACASGNRVIYVLGKIPLRMVKGIHSDFVVDEADLVSALA